jgi:hypothetical protein
MVPAYGTAATEFTVKSLTSFTSNSQDGACSPDTADLFTISLTKIASHASLADGHEELKTLPMHCQRLVKDECVITLI